MTRPVTRRAGAVSYQGVQDEILRRVRAREWPPGAAIPNEVDLAAEFGCARATMHRALRELAEAGVLERKRKAGTRVAPSPARRATLRIPVIRDEVEEAGGRYGFRLLSRALAPAAEAPPDSAIAATGGRLLHLTGLHLADDTPFIYEDRWVNPAAVPAVLDESFATISPNEWLVREAPFSDGRIAFSATPACAGVATRLGTAPGAALFTIHRTTRQGGTPITDVRMFCRPGYSLGSDL